MMKIPLKLFFLLALLSAFSLRVFAQISIKTTIDSDVIYAGVPCKILFTVHNASADNLILPNLNEFATTKSQGSSRNISFSNGIKTEKGERYIIVVFDSSGIFDLGEAKLVADNDTIKSEIFSVKVLDPLEDKLMNSSSENDRFPSKLEEELDDRLYFSDGSSIEGKAEMLKLCIDGFENAGNNSDLSLKPDKVCNCLLTSLASIHTQKSFLKTLGNNKKFLSALKNSSSPEYKVMYRCVISNSEALDNEGKAISISNILSNNPEIFLKTCEAEIESSLKGNTIAANIDFKSYCNCMLEKFIVGEITAEQMKEVLDPNSVLFNETVVPCLSQAEKRNLTGSPDDVLGDKPSAEILLTKLMNTYRLKVAVGNVEKYFILDSGASVTFITRELEEELIKAGIIQKKHYMGRQKFLMANGAMVDCRLVILNDVRVGEYILNNVMTAISETNQPILLLGKSVLDKFSNWKIDNDKSVLILER